MGRDPVRRWPFEVEKAVAPDGRTFDLKLSNVDFIILERDPED